MTSFVLVRDFVVDNSGIDVGTIVMLSVFVPIVGVYRSSTIKQLAMVSFVELNIFFRNSTQPKHSRICC